MSKVHIRTERRSLRLWIRIPVRASSKNADGKDFSEDTETIVINAHGGLLFLHQAVKIGADIFLTNVVTKEERRYVELSPWAILRTKACVSELNCSRLARVSGVWNSRLTTGTPIKILDNFPVYYKCSYLTGTDKRKFIQRFPVDGQTPWRWPAHPNREATDCPTENGLRRCRDCSGATTACALRN